jgi:hypothetical protein
VANIEYTYFSLYYIITEPHAELGRITVAVDKCNVGASAISAVALDSGGAC